MSYQRVIPRDLFNEAKLLKGLGRVALLILDGFGPLGLSMRHDDDFIPEFCIDQHQATGDLFAANVRLMYRGREVELASRYNSKAPYTLVARDSEDQCDVLTDEGEFTPEFLAYLEGLENKED